MSTNACKEYKLFGKTIRSKTINLKFRKDSFAFLIKLKNDLAKASRLKDSDFVRPSKKQQDRLNDAMLDWLNDKNNLQNMFKTLLETDMKWVNIDKVVADNVKYFELIKFSVAVLMDFFVMNRISAKK